MMPELFLFCGLLFAGLHGVLASSIASHAKPKKANVLKAIVVGDWGEPILAGQERCAEGMAIWAEENDPDWILSTGDNFYPKGITSPYANQVNRNWRDMYSHESLKNLNWYISIGNHDYGDWEDGEELNQLELAKIEPRWIFPALWYDFVEQYDDFSVHFIVIDTEAYHWAITRNNYTELIPWFERVLRESTADWKLVVGHRHIFSCGTHGPVTNSIYNAFVPIMERYNVDAYVCGHDHQLQHMKHVSGQGIDYILSGAGGAGVYLHSQENEDYLRMYYNIEPLFFRITFGFVTITASKESIVFDYFDTEAINLYSYTRYKSQSI